jgi:ComF family protein
MFQKARFVLDWIFPRRCLSCREFSQSILCDRCHLAFPFVTRAVCPLCASPLGEEEVSHLCGQCLVEPPPYQGLTVVGFYEGILHKLVERMKYHHEERVAEELGVWLAERLAKKGVEADRVVPIPLHPRRLRERGFNQSVVIARQISRRLGIPLELSQLRKIRETQPQTGLKAVERRDNVRGVFDLKEKGRLKKKRVLLIDDVLTTGATVRSCVSVLKKAGVDHVEIAVLARAL